MHQTSSRLLRMTDDDRPFTRSMESTKQGITDTKWRVLPATIRQYLNGTINTDPSTTFPYSASPLLSNIDLQRQSEVNFRETAVSSRRFSNMSPCTHGLEDFAIRPIPYNAKRVEIMYEAQVDVTTGLKHLFQDILSDDSGYPARDKFKLTTLLKSIQDFKDLFSTLMVSLPLTPHRVRFQKIEHTFTSEEAVTNLGSLKFSQSNRMPDPKDPSRIVTTTTTTTFSMAKEMARSVCQKFLEARFIETADGKNDFSSKSAVWQLTPKGMHILQRFCQRNGINQRHVFELLASPRNTMNLVILEREPDTDKIHRDMATVEVVFRRFVGVEPNIKYSTSNSDSDSLSEYQTGLVGVKLAKDRKHGDKTYHNTLTGKAVVDWLMDCCTMVDKRETYELAQLFCDYGLMVPIDQSPQNARFSPSKGTIYVISEKGQRVAGWITMPKVGLTSDSPVNGPRPRDGTTRDSNTNRMTIIIRDPALRLLFREFLRDTHCEENLAFYLDVRDFLNNYNTAKRHYSVPKLEIIRETLAAAYSLYNAFLAPGSPCELNIDHSLRTSLAARMTRAVGDDDAMIKSLDEVATLFDQAQNSVFKLMASDSVPKFMREPKYQSILRERNLDGQLGGANLRSTT